MSLSPQILEQLSASIPGSTPDLMAWLHGQLSAGYSATVLQQSLATAGWRPEVAEPALDAMTRWLHSPAPQTLPRPPVPEPRLGELPAEIDVGDRRVQVLLSMQHPRLVLFGNLLSPEECAALIAEAEPAMARSKTVATRTGGEEINADRTSDGMFFRRGETPTVQLLEARIARLLNWPLEYGEGLQILNYRPGAQYRPHHDYFAPDEPGTPAILERGGQRVATLVVYLNEVEAGGCTVFPETGLRVHPQIGQAVFFSYARPDPESRTLHGGDPVLRGEKWIATKWLREREFK